MGEFGRFRQNSRHFPEHIPGMAHEFQAIPKEHSVPPYPRAVRVDMPLVGHHHGLQHARLGAPLKVPRHRHQDGDHHWEREERAVDDGRGAGGVDVVPLVRLHGHQRAGAYTRAHFRST
jgi:hypothetical protein